VAATSALDDRTGKYIVNRKTSKTPTDYAWRYMLGKKDLLEKMGFLRDYTAGISQQPPTQSLRFTTPEWDLEMS
jgi:hypothetical protein